MIDADNLKVINDTYGHEMGDVYLQKISELATSMEGHGSVPLGFSMGYSLTRAHADYQSLLKEADEKINVR